MTDKKALKSINSTHSENLFNFVMQERERFSSYRAYKEVRWISVTHLLKFLLVSAYLFSTVEAPESKFFLYFNTVNLLFFSLSFCFNYIKIALAQPYRLLFFSNLVLLTELLSLLLLSICLREHLHINLYLSTVVIVLSLGLLPNLLLLMLQALTGYLALLSIAFLAKLNTLTSPASNQVLSLTDFSYFSLVYFITCLAVLQYKKTNHYRTMKSENKEEKQVLAHLYKRAYFDFLTGLYNRAMMEHKLESVIKKALLLKKGFFVLLFIDIDDFKEVNDSLGHRVGDLCLIKIAGRINALLKRWKNKYSPLSSFCARLSGDEFVIVVHQEEKKTLHGEILELCSGMQKVGKKDINIPDIAKKIEISVSIGANFFDWQKLNKKSVTWQEIRSFSLSQADKNMYQAKKNKHSSKNHHYIITNKVPQ